jgi:hypothetical protein
MNMQTNMRTGAATLDDGWRRWIADNLLRGADRGGLIGAMLGAGLDRLLIEQELRSAEEHPYLLAARRLQARSAKQHWMASALGRLEELDPCGVEHRETIDRRTFFEEFYARNRPLTLTRAIEDWRAPSLWSLDYLEQAAAGATVEIQAGRSVDPHYEQYSANYKRVSTWRAFLTALRRGGISNDFYLTANNGAANRQALAPLWRDFGPIDGLLSGDWREQGFLWLGPQGTITPWHHDLTNNLLVQIVGRKRITLASPAQTPRMRNHCHCYSEFGQDAACSGAGEGNRPHLLRCELGPGELVFLPIGWWHHVEALDLSASLTLTNFEGPNDFHKNYTTFDAL